VDSLRSLFSRLRFDETRASRLITALESYHYKYDSKNRVYSRTPHHDDNSHGADAMRDLPLMYSKEFERYAPVKAVGMDEPVFYRDDEAAQ
jgi:hypothetical protein